MPKRRSAILPTLVIAAVLVVVFAIYTNVWTDRLWYVSMNYGSVFSKLLLTRIGLFAAFGIVMAGAVLGSAAIAFRLRPRHRPSGPTTPLLERYREALESRFLLLAAVLAVVIGLFAGGAATSKASIYLAWINGQSFGTDDPRFGIDLSFYIFDYPWWRFVLSFAFTTLVFAAIAGAIVHYVMGAIHFTGPRRGGTTPAQAHLSVVVGLAVLVKGATYWFDQYGLMIADAPRFTGMSYTADHATVNAKIILSVIAGICALLFFANAVLRRWIVPTIALTLMLLSAIVLGIVYPAAVQGLSVRPDEPDKERPFIQWNIDATRKAYDVADVQISNYSAKTTATAGQLRSDAESLPGVRLIDPAVVAPTYEQLQQVRGYYSFPSILDVDRYKINGEQTDAVVAARELDRNGIPEQSWNNLHTVYTHGYGLVAAYGNRRQADGSPEWLAQGIPPTGPISEHEPRIYYGELLDQLGFSVVGARPNGSSLELDTPGGGENDNPKLYTYTGKGGVSLSSLWRRLLYAVKFTDVNLLLSDRVNDESKIIYDRSPKERVQKAAPWLTVDRDSYPAVVDGRLVWIVDAYTTSNSYPNSQRVSLQDATADTRTDVNTIGAQLDTKINYMRNSVKAVVDAYDGSVSLYEWDSGDPILKTWEKAFPGTVMPKSSISADLLAHLRYPQDMYKVQRQILGQYHVTDPTNWYQNGDLWKVPPDPVQGTATLESPYYLSVKYPGDDQANFSLTSVYVPNNRSNLAAYMAVNADASSPTYGQMRILRMSDTTQIDGPGQSFNAMTTSTVVADTLRPFLNQGSSRAQYGNLLTLPVGGGLLYVQPIYTTREGTGGGQYPVLRYVMVRFGQSVGIGDTLQDALDQVFKGDSGASTGETGGSGSGTGTGTGSGTGTGQADNPAAVRSLNEAETAFSDAEKALREGDLATYQEKTKEAKAAVDAALKSLGR